MFGDDDKLCRETIADRLRGAFPGVYADITPEAVASQLRALGVDVKRVRERGKPIRSRMRAGRRRRGRGAPAMRSQMPGTRSAIPNTRLPADSRPA